jgi:dolichol-phosphate mannosyltransferase
MTQQLTVILPTYNEVENVVVLIPKLCDFLKKEGFSFSILVMDDNSPDGTAQKAKELSKSYPVEVVVRTENRSLSWSVIDGFSHARSDVLVVMDADGSHPFESIPDMVNPILNNEALVSVGVRYTDAGDTSGFSFIREAISIVSGLIAKGLTSLSDPTSGFMAVKKSALENLKLNPIGWKIVLEVVVKLGKVPINEVPITFKDRVYGKSKLSFKASYSYLAHLLRLYLYKYL